MANLYRVSQDVRRGYDTYDSMVVCAVDEDAARMTLPSEYEKWNDDAYGAWAARPEQVKVTLIGVADEKTPLGVVLASFNAG